MSLSALPEWKQMLLERKRREEEERERREREEEERLASMPAWKRGIIQRRRAKQDEERERERERDGGQQTPDVAEDVVTEQTESKLTHLLQTDPGHKVQKQISKETISPIHQNPFIRSENSFRRDSRGKEATRDGENDCKKTIISKGRERNRDAEMWRGRDREMWVEKTGNKSEGREQDRSTGRESREPDGYKPVVGLRTIQANNIIIIEKEKLDRRNKEVEEEEKRMRMDLREFLACGGSVTEIRASEVLIIKPSVTDGKRENESGSGEDRLERAGIWTSMRLTSRAVMQRAERVLNHKDKGCSGRVSQLLSRFGEHPKPPMRSKSTDCFNRPGKSRARYSTGDLFVRESQGTEETDPGPDVRGVPKRSFSFSDRVARQQENQEEMTNVKVMERTYSDRRVKTRITGTDPSESHSRVTRRWGRPKHDEGMQEKRRKETRVENKKNEERSSSVDGGEGLTLEQEAVTSAQQVPIKDDGRERGDVKGVREENERGIETDKEKQAEEEEMVERQTPVESEKDEVTVEASTQAHDAHIPFSGDSAIDFTADIRCECVDNPSVEESCVFTAHAGQREQEQVHSDGELKRESHANFDADKISEISEQDQKEHHSFPKRATEEMHLTSQFPHQSVTLGKLEGVSIPRTVFYGVDVSAKRRASLPGRDGEGERRGSWKAGRPLTRVESLKERIRQQEKEKQKSREDNKEAEGAVREQEDTLQAVRVFDVTQDVSMAKSSPQLPVPVSLSLLQSTEREVGEFSIDASESDIYLRKTERETDRHVEEGETGQAWRTQDSDGGEDQLEREEELLEEEYLPPSLSPSPPLSDSLDAMSRIYNLKTVGSRTAVCISERTADLPPHSGLQGKYNPVRQAPSPDVLPETAKLWKHARDGDKPETVESTGVQMVQHHVERLQLREPEAGCGSHSDRKPQSPRAEPEVRVAEGQKRPDILRETQKSQAPTSPRFPQPQQRAQRPPSKPPQLRSFTVNSRITESPEKPPEQSSPSSSSPCTASPSSTPSPPLFSIRSASGGPGKRGTTITITPRRPAAGNSVPTPKAASLPAPAPSSTRDAGKKKRYPTAEEIEVIGGYQNLERSCLVKSRASPKAVKVCFDEAQLERVCEYPSEDCVLASLPCSPHPGPEDGGREEGWRGGEQEEEEDEEEESAAFASRSASNERTGKVRFLKVDESCKRLSK